MALHGEHYYDGFHTFSWLADFVGVPIDQFNFLITQFTALMLASLLRNHLSAKNVAPQVRHVYSLIVGLGLAYFCFGRQAIHIVALPILCYFLLFTQNPRIVQRVVLLAALLYLSAVHIHRQLYDYGSYSLDITGPLMVITQKVTSLAFNVHDGLARKQEELISTQRQYVITKIPGPLEYFSYVFHFQALMAGPMIFYNDYIKYIQGSSSCNNHTPRSNGTNGKANGSTHHSFETDQSPFPAVVKKVIGSLFCAAVFVTLIPLYPIQRVKDNEFLTDTSLVYKFWYLVIATTSVRFKYYFAWIFADAICNNSGIGFNGYNDDGTARWDRYSNVDAVKFETALNLKENIDSWNKGTNSWLRSIVYERTTENRTLKTFALSCVWHGFYPGYYLTFATAAVFTFAARNVRRCVRPYFVGSKSVKRFYDVLTCISTRLILSYATFSFILLEFKPSITLYLHMYLVPHLLGLLAIFALPKILAAPKTSKSNHNNQATNGHAKKTE